MTTVSERQKKKYRLHPEDIVVVMQLTHFDDGITKPIHFKTEKRGFVPVYEPDDWLEDERDFKPG